MDSTTFFGIDGLWHPFIETIAANSFNQLILQMPQKFIAKTDLKISGISTYSGIATGSYRGGWSKMEKIVISRKWGNPNILTTIKVEEGEGVEISIEMDKFKELLIKEIGTIWYTMTLSQLETKINNAVNSIINGMKQDSVEVANLIPIGR